MWHCPLHTTVGLFARIGKLPHRDSGSAHRIEGEDVSAAMASEYIVGGQCELEREPSAQRMWGDCSLVVPQLLHPLPANS